MQRAVLLILLAGAAKPDLLTLARAGQNLTDQKAAELQGNLKHSPDDAALRAQILGYDLSRKSDLRAGRLEGILWMIENRTADPLSGSIYCQIDTENTEDFAKAKAAWDAQLAAHPNNAPIAANAAGFYAVSDFDAAVALLQQAITLEPKNANWPESLAQVYEHRFNQHPDDTARLAPLALQLRQAAYNLTPNPGHRFRVLVRMPADAIAAADLIAAKRYARQLLATAPKFKSNVSYGDAIYWGNMSLGEVAFRAGRIDDSEDDLNAATQTPSSDELQTTGPDFNLAKELLGKGERTPVHDYLTACKKIWPAGEQRLKAWLTTLDAGGTPDF